MDDAAQECRILVTTYLKYAIDNARSALTLMGEPATTEASINMVLTSLATIATDS